MIDLDNALRKMGKAWFLSYYVHCYYDGSDYSYTNPDDFYLRTLVFDAVCEYHTEILNRVLKTPVKQLCKNTIGVTENQINDFLNLIKMNEAA